MPSHPKPGASTSGEDVEMEASTSGRSSSNRAGRGVSREKTIRSSAARLRQIREIMQFISHVKESVHRLVPSRNTSWPPPLGISGTRICLVNLSDKHVTPKGGLQMYRILILAGLPAAVQLDPKEIVPNLQRLTQHQIVPFFFTSRMKCVEFYVDDIDVAEALSKNSKMQLLPSGKQVLIRTSAINPEVRLTVEVKQTLERIIENRYDAQTAEALDLSSFYRDPALRDTFFCPIDDQRILRAVWEIIREKFPGVVTLNLSGNHLFCLKDVVSYSSGLRIGALDLGGNKIEVPRQLNPLRHLNLQELSLIGTPLYNQLRTNTMYREKIQRLLPSLRKLDGEELPENAPPDDLAGLPDIEPSYFCDTNVWAAGELVMTSLFMRYFRTYDSDNRAALEAFYYSGALFTFTAYMEPVQQGEAGSALNSNDKSAGGKPSNTVKVPITTAKGIGSFLATLPKSEHNIGNFTVDMTYCTPTMIVITISGLYKEHIRHTRTVASQASFMVYHFYRTFVLVPASKSYDDPIIINESFVVTRPTDAQLFLLTISQTAQNKNVRGSPAYPDSLYPKMWNSRRSREAEDATAGEEARSLALPSFFTPYIPTFSNPSTLPEDSMSSSSSEDEGEELFEKFKYLFSGIEPCPPNCQRPNCTTHRPSPRVVAEQMANQLGQLRLD